jgi:hypothetical protein
LNQELLLWLDAIGNLLRLRKKQYDESLNVRFWRTWIIPLWFNPQNHHSMKNKKTYYQLILDRSGSMSSCIEETVSGVNSQISNIRELSEQFPEQELITSFNLFNHNLTPVWDRSRASEIKEIKYSDFKPKYLMSIRLIHMR